MFKCQLFFFLQSCLNLAENHSCLMLYLTFVFVEMQMPSQKQMCDLKVFVQALCCLFENSSVSEMSPQVQFLTVVITGLLVFSWDEVDETVIRMLKSCSCNSKIIILFYCGLKYFFCCITSDILFVLGHLYC